MNQRFGHIQPATRGVVILDPEAPDRDRLGCVIPLAQRRDHARVHRMGKGDGLERRPEFIDTLRHIIAARILARLTRLVRVVDRQRNHRHQFAGMHVKHQAGRSLGLLIDHCCRKFAFHCCLDARVNRKSHRPSARLRIGQLRIQDTLHPRNTASVEISIAQHMGGECRLRIKPFGFAGVGHGRLTQRVDLGDQIGQRAPP